jgi:hypothetical protein
MVAGYSGTPLARKLGVKPGHVLALVGAPPGWQVEGLPDGVTVRRDPAVPGAEVTVAFFRDLASLGRGIPGLARSTVADAALWVAWPRRAGGHTSDIRENDIRAAVLPLGLVDVKVAALDNDWSGLKMVWRKEMRPRPGELARLAARRAGHTDDHHVRGACIAHGSKDHREDGYGRRGGPV